MTKTLNFGYSYQDSDVSYSYTNKVTMKAEEDDEISPTSLDCVMFPELCQIDLGGSSFVYAQNLGIGYSYSSAIEFSGDTDYYRVMSNYTNWIRIYSTGNLDIKAYVYQSPNTTTYIEYNDNISQLNNTDDPIIGNLRLRALAFTSDPNFYFELYAEAGVTYYIKVQPSIFGTVGEYTMYANDSCFCDHPISDYTYSSSSDSVPSNFEVNYIFDENNFYYEILDAMEMWDSVGKISFVPDTIYTTNDLVFHVNYDLNATALGLYYRIAPFAGSIVLYYYPLQYTTYNSIVSVAEHEIGHALDLDEMYTSNPTVSIEDWRNAMTAGGHNTVELGPCDLAAYHEMWGD